MFDVPDYVRWIERQPLVPNYLYQKQQLQLLSWKMRGDYWVVKSPAHLFGLEAILAVFPDASIVVTHRDPLEVIPSVSSLAAGFRGILTDRLDLRRLGAEMAEAMAVGPRRAIADRATADPSRFFDVSYARLVADPIATLRDDLPTTSATTSPPASRPRPADGWGRTPAEARSPPLPARGLRTRSRDRPRAVRRLLRLARRTGDRPIVSPVGDVPGPRHGRCGFALRA